MKLAIMTDIHLDTNSLLTKKDLFPDLLYVLNKTEYDVLFITGDISNSSRTTINILDKIKQETKRKVLYIPGNHDVTKFGESSWESYNLLKDHESSLIDRPYKINDKVVIIGDMGWYDYSFAPEDLNHQIIKQRKKSLWDDGKYVKWNMDDSEMFKFIYEKLKIQFEQCKNKQVIFGNHFIPYKDFILHSSDAEWNLCNGFMGSKMLGNLIDAYPNISHVLFGHTHRRYGVLEGFENKTIICNPVGYQYEWKTEDVRHEFASCINIITIKD